MRAALDTHGLADPNMTFTPLERAFVVLPGAQLLDAANNLQALSVVGLVAHLESKIVSFWRVRHGAIVLARSPDLLVVFARLPTGASSLR